MEQGTSVPVEGEGVSKGAELPEVLDDHGIHVYTTPDAPGFLATFKSQWVLLVSAGVKYIALACTGLKILW